MTWTAQQDAALVAVSDWLATRSKPFFYLAGYAGTGKTTLAMHLAASVHGDVCFAAFTGKAASVMAKKGCKDARTIHSSIYRYEDDPISGEGTYYLDPDGPAAKASLIVIDECSMVNEDIGRDVLSFGKPVLVLGDPAQLPPVSGAGFFTGGKPDYLLTEVHRQARDNPIIRASMDVREGRKLTRGNFGALRVISRAEVEPRHVLDAGIILVGKNATRDSFNKRYRERLGRRSIYPEAGDRLVCLRNNKEKKLMNGTLWDLVSVKASEEEVKGRRARNAPKVRLSETDLDVVLRDAEGERIVKGETRVELFDGRFASLPPREVIRYLQFDYGYALTVHKSQGSQWDDVILFDESGVFREDAARHLYTGMTRAAKTLTVVQYS